MYVEGRTAKVTLVSVNVIPLPRREAPAAQSLPIRVLLADGESLVRAGLRALLDADDRIEVVAVAADAVSAVQQAVRVEPDVVVLDARLGAVTALAKAVPAARIL